MEDGGVTCMEQSVAPRAYWKGYLKLSLVSCPIALFPATSERERSASTRSTRTPVIGSNITRSTPRVATRWSRRHHQGLPGRQGRVPRDRAGRTRGHSDREQAHDRDRRVRAEEGNRRALPQQPLLHRAGRRSRQQAFAVSAKQSAKRAWSRSARWCSRPASTSSR